MKKRLPQNQQANKETLKQSKKQSKLGFDVGAKQEQNDDEKPQCSSDISSHNNNNSNNSISSSVVTTNNHDSSNNNYDVDSAENNFAMDEDFWSEVLSSDKSSSEGNGAMDIGADNYELQVGDEGVFSSGSLSLCEDMDFWHDVYARAEEITELLEL